MSATIRHSALDKLDLCPCFESNPVSGPAAERGTRMDAAYRGLLMGERQPFLSLPEDEQDSVMWAVQMAKELAEGHEIIADEALLKVTTPHLSHEGTEDSRVNAKSMSMDLKSGQMRPYHKQQAAYALGNMDRTFAKEWECVLLFCDQREVVHYRYTYEEADAWVKGIVQSATDPNRKPCANEYCSWCVKKDTCPQVVEPVVQTLATVESSVSLADVRQGILADPERLGKFLKAASIFEKELLKPLKDAAKEILAANCEVPGWKLQHQTGSEYFDRIAIVSAAVAGKSGLDDLVTAMGGDMSGKAFREWHEKMRMPVREENAQRKADIVKLVEDKPKKGKSK
jgi:Protein of unknown function (DUF2800)